MGQFKRYAPVFSSAILFLVGCSSDPVTPETLDAAGGTGGAGGNAGTAGTGGAEPVTCDSRTAGHDQNPTLGCGQRCPGDADCAASEDATFYAGAAVEDITPKVDHVVVRRDGGPDDRPHEFDEFEEKCVAIATCNLEAAADCDTADKTKCTWIAGFGSGRPAAGVADPTSVRCAVVKQGNTAVALCSIDAVGWFYNEIERTREYMAETYPDVEVDMLVVGATHVHETQDTLGQWGPNMGTSGTKPEFNKMIREKTAAAVAKAYAELKPVQIQFGSSLVDGHIAVTDPAGNKTASFVSDTRDPVVIDNELRTIRFVSSEDQSTVATLINFASHPEFAGSRNQLSSADFVGVLRTSVEEGLTVKSKVDDSILYEGAGVGGVAIFFNGAVGGQVGPGEVVHTDFDGDPVPGGLERAYNNGRLLSVYAHEALTTGVTEVETAALGFRAREIFALVENTAYHFAINGGLFDREGELYSLDNAISRLNPPSLRTQIVVVDIGPAELVTVPAEIHAELVLGNKADGTTALDAPYPFTPAPFFVNNDVGTNPNCGADGYSRCDDGPPDLGKFDRNRVIDLARDGDSKFHWLLGLTQDELGYIVPEFDYKLHEDLPYFDEASPGNHYEETNSVGPSVQKHMTDPILELLGTDSVIER